MGTCGKAIRAIGVVVIAVFALASAASADTHWMATNGSDSYDGTDPAHPLLTLQHACSVMTGGDTLIIKDGTYTGTSNTVTASTFYPPFGSSGAWTVIKAEHDGGAVFQGASINFDTSSGDRAFYWQFEGIIWKGSTPTSNDGWFNVSFGNHVKALRCGVYDSGSGNIVCFCANRGTSYILFENCYAWGSGRYKFLAYGRYSDLGCNQTQNIIFRQCVARMDYEDAGQQQIAGFTAYSVKNAIVQNCIVIDCDTKAHWHNQLNASGSFLVPTTNDDAHNITFENCVALNNQLGGIVSESSGYRAWDVVAKNNVVWNCENWETGAWVDSSRGERPQWLNNTFGVSSVGYACLSAYDGNNHTITNNLLYNITGMDATQHWGDYGGTHDYNAFYLCAQGLPTLSAHEHTDINPIWNASTNPTGALKYIARIEAGSNLSGIGSGGANIGATVTNMIGAPGTLYGDPGYDTVQATSMWPFPYEGLIKTKMATYSYDGINGARGFCAPGNGLNGLPRTLTSYIWEYLGNACPSDIYGSGGGLAITTSSLPADTINIAYNQTLAAAGGTTPYTWSLQSGSLPTGLSLVASTGAITGTPTASGTSSFTAKVTDNVAATATKALSIVVNAAPSITTSSLPNGTTGTAYNQTLAASGGTTPFTWSLLTGSLPAGLSLVASTGAITGTPTASGTSNFTAKVTDNVGASASRALSIVVNAGPSTYSIWSPSATPTTPDSGPDSQVEVGVQFKSDVAGNVTSIRFYKGTGNTGTHVGSLWSIGGTRLAYATFSGETGSGWQQVDFGTPVAITAGTVYVASYNTTVGHYACDQNYFASAGVDNPPLHALQNGVSGALNGVYAYGAAGTFPNQAWNASNYWVDVVFASGGTPLSVTTSSLPADTVGVAYNQTLQATGGTTPYTWAIASGSLPAGLSLVAGTGAITGTPTASGTSNFTARVTDNVAATATKALSIVINAAISITTSSLPADTVNIAYNQTLAATGGTGALTWSLNAGSLPAGLSLTAAGVISGTPTASGTSNLTAKATDTVGASATKALSIVVNAALSITTSSLPGGAVGVAYNQTLARSGGTTPFTWAISSGSLPAGLSLVGSTGVISGTPTASGTSNFTARVTDNVGATATKALSIAVTATLTITTSSLPADTVGVAYSQTLAASGGTTPYTWAISSGSLPAGLSLVAGTGAITGTPTTSGTSNFTARVTDNVAATATKALSIVINAAVSITTSSLPADTINVAYNQTLAATGGTGAKTWAISSGSLPTGLSLNSSTGAITGTPTASGTSNFTARATDAVGATGTKALSIVINAAPSITTSSLPGGTVGTAYSQTMAATGGTTPLTWAVLSGSLPAGLSLNSSTGAITGTPTASGTSNFTARVTDNVSATATKALSIAIASGGTSATYQFIASDSESNTTSTNWVNKATMTFTPNTADDWVILGFAEFKESTTSYRDQIQLTVDGTVIQASDVAPKATTDYQSFSGLKLVNLSAASHTFNIDYKTSNASGTAYIRRARIVAVKKTTLELYSADGGDSGSDLTTTETTYASVSFTPSATADYEFIWSAEWTTNTTAYNTVVIGGFNDGTNSYSSDISTVTSNNTSNYYTFLGNKTVNLASGVQVTAQVRAYKQSGSTGTHHIRRAHLAVFNITTGRFANFLMARDDNETTTTSTTFQQKTTASKSISTAADWLVIDTFRVGNSSTSYSSEGQVQLDNSTTMANPMRSPQSTGDYIQNSCIDVRNLSTGTRVFDQDYRTSNSSGTAKCKNGHFIALPL